MACEFGSRTLKVILYSINFRCICMGGSLQKEKRL
jgi:hypothetical protein